MQHTHPLITYDSMYASNIKEGHAWHVCNTLRFPEILSA